MLALCQHNTLAYYAFYYASIFDTGLCTILDPALYHVSTSYTSHIILETLASWNLDYDTKEYIVAIIYTFLHSTTEFCKVVSILATYILIWCYTLNSLNFQIKIATKISLHVMQSHHMLSWNCHQEIVKEILPALIGLTITHIYSNIKTCTTLLEQIIDFRGATRRRVAPLKSMSRSKGFTKIFLLVGSYTMLSWHL